MSLALFDLDNTLLGGDSDYEWGQFLVDHGLVDSATYALQNRKFYEQYLAGELDIYAFARFAYRPLAENPLPMLLGLRAEFLDERIRPLILPKARELLDHHRSQGHQLVIITSTNRFITEPIAQAFGVEHLIATDPEFRNGHYTGEIAGIPCFQEGKVKRLNGWLVDTGQTLEDSWFYSDSLNDLPLLKCVTHPVAVDPDEQLAARAREQGWRIISLRDTRP